LDFLKGVKKSGAGIPAKTSTELREALLAVNRPTLPFIVRDGSAEKVDLVAEWHIADDIWCKLFATAGLDKTFKILIRLDANKHEVRAADQAWCVEWRAGVPRLSLSSGMFRWQNTEIPTGLTEAGMFRWPEITTGLTEDGVGYDWLNNTGPSSATTRFAFTEIGVKSPLQEAVTAAGWTWRDVELGSL
jgi:hypothetical protein